MNLVIWGAKGHCKVVVDALEHMGAQLLAVGDNDEGVRSPFDEIPIFHDFQSMAAFVARCQSSDSTSDIKYVAAIGGSRGSDRISIGHELEALGFSSMIVRHPTASLSSSALVGAGGQLLANSSTGPGAVLGRSVIVNTGAIVEHECKLGDGVHVAPNATVLGEVTVGNFAFIGANSTILPRVIIGEGAIVGAGAVVTKSVPARAVVRGVPAR